MPKRKGQSSCSERRRREQQGQGGGGPAAGGGGLGEAGSEREERWAEACGSVLDNTQPGGSGAQSMSRESGAQTASEPPGGSPEGGRAQGALGHTPHSAKAGSARPPDESDSVPQAPGLPDGAFRCWAVERRALPPLEEFLRDFMLRATPVILTQAMAHWPALQRWRETAYLEGSLAGALSPLRYDYFYCPMADGRWHLLYNFTSLSHSCRHVLSTASSSSMALYTFQCIGASFCLGRQLPCCCTGTTVLRRWAATTWTRPGLRSS